jgi:hypothetical protein
MKALVITMLTVGLAILLARIIDNDRTLHVIRIIIGDAE